MTTPPQTISDAVPVGGGAATPDARAGVASLPRQALAALRALPGFLSRERHWLILAVPFLLSWIAPFKVIGVRDSLFDGPLRWCAIHWFNSNSAEAFQPLIPLGVALLIWSRREDLKKQYDKLARSYPATHAKRRGNPVAFLIGCVALLLAYFVQVKGFAVAAEIVIFVGALYWVYGPVMLRALLVPLSILPLMIPPPDSIIERICQRAAAVSVPTAARVLKLLGRDAAANFGGGSGNWFVSAGGQTVEVVKYIADGAGSLLTAGVAMLVYCLYTRRRPTTAAFLIPAAAGLAAVLNILRIAGAFVLKGASPDLSDRLLNSNGYLLVALAVGLTLLLERLLGVVGRNALNPLQRAAVGTGMGMDKATRPLARGIMLVGRLIGNVWVRSERATEGMFRKLFPKKRGGRGRRGRR